MEKILGLYHKQDPAMFWSTFSTFLMFSAIVTLFAINYPNLPSQLPLFYSLAWGEDQLVTTPQFMIMPALIALITFINITISWHLHKSQMVLKRMLALSSTIIAFLMLTTAIKVIFIFV